MDIGYMGVSFGGHHSYADWGLELLGPPIFSAPEPQTTYLSVPTRDGALDLTAVLTDTVHYNDREFTATFLSYASPTAFAALFSEILNAIHGQRLQIVADTDPSYAYDGRCMVSELAYNSTDGTWSFIVTAACSPYKTNLTDGTKSL